MFNLSAIVLCSYRDALGSRINLIQDEDFFKVILFANYGSESEPFEEKQEYQFRELVEAHKFYIETITLVSDAEIQFADFR